MRAPWDRVTLIAAATKGNAVDVTGVLRATDEGELEVLLIGGLVPAAMKFEARELQIGEMRQGLFSVNRVAAVHAAEEHRGRGRCETGAHRLHPGETRNRTRSMRRSQNQVMRHPGVDLGARGARGARGVVDVATTAHHARLLREKRKFHAALPPRRRLRRLPAFAAKMLPKRQAYRIAPMDPLMDKAGIISRAYLVTW